MPSMRRMSSASPRPTPGTSRPKSCFEIGYDHESRSVNGNFAKKMLTTSGKATRAPVTNRLRRKPMTLARRDGSLRGTGRNQDSSRGSRGALIGPRL
jgi:hypothetical protein